ncbi:MAG: 50S ribosomal protein L2, partial [Candidatus Aenigmarchaeota archaeon]|nr:50S ribosomal protein L2 [Candidatus Aenigmarchaeota archaeon]
MGKPLRQQRRGKGSLRYISPGHKFLGKVKYKGRNLAEGTVIDIVHDPARYCPVAVVDFSENINNKIQKWRELLIAPKGLKVGDKINYGNEPKFGNILPVENIPEGTQICNIELTPFDGGKMCRAPGTFATVMGHEKNETSIMLTSKAIKKIPNKCRAMIGVVAGAGHRMKPFLKAGAKFRAMHTKGRYYPIVSGVSKSAVEHPFGGSTKPGKPTSVSRHAPPGAKVGSLSPKRTGKRK